MSSPKRILFCAKDAGGANAIAPVVAALAEEGASLQGVLVGPAQDIFSAARMRFTSQTASAPDIFIAGTSAGDSPDKQIMKTLGSAPSLYVLDFWLNYWQRFSTAGEKDFAYMPTRICVMDDVARQEMLAEGFPAERLVVTGNPHFDHFADSITRENEEKERILFVSQPLSSVANMPGFSPVAYDEYATLKDILQALGTLPEQYYVSLRLHPKEPADKYAEFLGPRVRRAPEKTLEEALSGAGLIVGISSPVLMQAAAAGKRVLSYEPELSGKDPLVSNRAGVTTRVESKKELADAMAAYARGEWLFITRSLREVWPLGATERVVAAVHALTAEK
ncbi:MAG: hypothetical protein Q7S05_01480 [bacterium]|nr:hypothetical protein [bacterium]